MNYISTFKNFLDKIQEGLIKTYDITTTFDKIQNDLDRFNYKYSISKTNNKINIILQDYCYTITNEKLTYLLSTMINLFGWFPASMKVTKMFFGKPKTRTLIFNEKEIRENFNEYLEVEIIFEEKYSKLEEIPNKIYHLTIEEYLPNILKNGLSPKLSFHPERIYVCLKPKDCIALQKRLEMVYTEHQFKKPLSKINTKMVLLEINTQNIKNLYEDPNYPNGYFILDNVSPKNIKICTQ